ncbi:MAG: hypothetical protein QM699_06710 [Amaricoccus sp.]|uniref:hypothetical protein n=1 Tax=Amaricoccus sp. TaxID=1872485 RepID=UPI0039E46BEB
MTAPQRRGACPSLDAPMATGDGFLARLAFDDALSAAQLAGIAEVAARLGNGLVEVTSRGSLQIRGLAEGAPLAAALRRFDLPLAAGTRVVTSPLAGRDPAERADPRPLAAGLRRQRLPLPPKVTVLVDGGGAFSLDAVPADVRLAATGTGWRVGVGGTAATARWGDAVSEASAERVALGLLDRLSRERQRGRDLDGVPDTPGPAPRVGEAIGRFTTRDGTARGIGFAFGIAESAAVAALAKAAGNARFYPAPGRALLALGLGDEAAFVAEAGRLGFVIAATDPRQAISACAGAPACGAGRIATRRIAARIAAEAPAVARGARLHLSGCPKRCAQPAGPAVSLVADEGGARVSGDGRPVPVELESYLLEAAAW